MNNFLNCCFKPLWGSQIINIQENSPFAPKSLPDFSGVKRPLFARSGHYSLACLLACLLACFLSAPCQKRAAGCQTELEIGCRIVLVASYVSDY